MNNYLIERYRKESPVFNSQPGNVYQDYILPGDLDSMKSYLLRLTGSTKRKGEYYDPTGSIWKPARIPALEAALQEIPKRFEKYQQSEKNRGNPPLSAYPSGLIEEEERLQARLVVAKEELKFLRKEIKAKKTVEPEPDVEPVKPRKYWGSGRLHGGILCEIGGFSVQPDKEGLLLIADSRSKHNGMPVWQFKTQVWKPMSWEFGFRDKQERTAAQEERRPYKEPPYPEAGIWDKETDKIEYPNYDQSTLKKCIKN